MIRKDRKMGKKKKTENIGTITALNALKASQPIQDIPFRTGAYKNKKHYKREKINKNRLDKWL